MTTPLDMTNLRGSFKLTQSHPANWTIVAGKAQNCEWSVHGELLASLLGWCKTVIESSFREAEEKTIRFPEESAPTIARLMIWMYYGQYPVFFNVTVLVNEDMSSVMTIESNHNSNQAGSSQTPTLRDLLRNDEEATEEVKNLTQQGDLLVNIIITSLEMYDKSCEYDIPKLRDNVIFRLSKTIRGRPRVFWVIRDHAELHNANPIIDTKSLDDLVHKTMMDDLKLLRKEERFQALLKSDPELTLKLFHEVAERQEASEEAEKARLKEIHNDRNKRPRNGS